jgi:hypothetical protein
MVALVTRANGVSSRSKKGAGKFEQGCSKAVTTPNHSNIISLCMRAVALVQALLQAGTSAALLQVHLCVSGTDTQTAKSCSSICRYPVLA